MIASTVYGRCLPDSFRRNSKKQDIHFSQEILVREFGTDCSYVVGEIMIGKKTGIPMVLVKMVDDTLRPTPHENVVVRITEMVCKT